MNWWVGELVNWIGELGPDGLARQMQSRAAMGFADELQERFHQFAMETVRYTRTLPDTDDAREWGKQLRRASTGASAIYRSSRRGKSRADWLDKIADTVEEIDECSNWFEVIEEAELPPAPKNLRTEARELRAILAKSLATGRAHERKKKEQRGRKKPDP